MLHTEHFTFHGLDCVAVHTSMGHWCGYVAVPPSHPLHGKPYSDHVRAPAARRNAGVNLDRMSIREVFCNMNNPGEELSIALLFDVHGSLSYSDPTVDTYPAYVPGVWWFGFDCAHHGDRENPKNLSYVINELKGLAKQLAEYVPEPPLAITHQPSAEQVV